MTHKWLFNGLYIDHIPDELAVGFVYRIDYIDEDGKVRSYIGKKNFWSTRTVKKGKKELAAMTDKRGSKKKKVVKESDWVKYQSSNTFLKSCRPETLKKYILELCYSKAELTYKEVKYQFKNDVLESDLWLNSNILNKFFKQINNNNAN